LLVSARAGPASARPNSPTVPAANAIRNSRHQRPLPGAISEPMPSPITRHTQSQCPSSDPEAAGSALARPRLAPDRLPRVRLLRAEVNGARVVLLDSGGERSLATVGGAEDRKSTRLNSSHSQISYAVFCLK